MKKTEHQNKTVLVKTKNRTERNRRKMTKLSDIEKRFDDKFVGYWVARRKDSLEVVSADEIKSFLRQEIQNLLKKIGEGMRVEEDERPDYLFKEADKVPSNAYELGRRDERNQVAKEQNQKLSKILKNMG